VAFSSSTFILGQVKDMIESTLIVEKIDKNIKVHKTFYGFMVRLSKNLDREVMHF